MKLIHMSKKTIQILVVVLCFVGSGLVLYFGYFKPRAVSMQLPPSAIGSVAANGALQSGSSVIKGDEPILPFDKLKDSDLKILKEIKGDSYTQEYPKLDKKSEVGIDVKDLIPPLPQAKE